MKLIFILFIIIFFSVSAFTEIHIDTKAKFRAPLEKEKSEKTEDSKEEKDYIELDLKDEESTPIPSDSYEITSPDGETIEEGSLDASGQGHISAPEPGTCQVDFPGLDTDAWERDEEE